MVKRPSRLPPQRLAADARREQILTAALAVFARGGYAGSGTRQLAEAAGVSEPILYRHFATKAELFADVVALVEERVLAALREVVAPHADARGRILALGKGLDALLLRLQDELRVLNGAAVAHAELDQVRSVRRAFSRIGDFLTQALAGGHLRAGVTPDLAAWILLEVGLGSSLLRPVAVPAVVRDGFGQRVIEVLTAALLDPRPGGRK